MADDTTVRITESGSFFKDLLHHRRIQRTGRLNALMAGQTIFSFCWEFKIATSRNVGMTRWKFMRPVLGFFCFGHLPIGEIVLSNHSYDGNQTDQ